VLSSGIDSGRQHNVIQVRKKCEQRRRPSVARAVELRLGLCFPQNLYGGWYPWLRDAGNGACKVRKNEPTKEALRPENIQSRQVDTQLDLIEYSLTVKRGRDRGRLWKDIGPVRPER